MNFRFLKIAFGISIVFSIFSLNQVPSIRDYDPSLDSLFNNFEQKDAKVIAENLLINGKKYTWEEYVEYGRELFYNGFVEKSPVDGANSKRISKYEDYTCVKCHNIVREDRVLTVQDPESRYDMSTTNNGIKLTQGTTLWGAVNRTSFYNGIYADYRTLKVPKGDIDNPKSINCIKEPEKCKEFDFSSLNEAIQICSLYCSDGIGYLDKWELFSLLAFLWSNETKLSDLGFSEEVKKEIIDVLENRENHTIDEIKEQEGRVVKRLLLASSATSRTTPKFTRINKWISTVNRDESPFFMLEMANTNVLHGKRLFEITCLQCHYDGSTVSDDLAEDLGYDEERFYEVLYKGTKPRRKQPYMPEYPLERLNHTQAENILAYLKTLQ